METTASRNQGSFAIACSFFHLSRTSRKNPIIPNHSPSSSQPLTCFPSFISYMFLSTSPSLSTSPISIKIITFSVSLIPLNFCIFLMFLYTSTLPHNFNCFSLMFSIMFLYIKSHQDYYSILLIIYINLIVLFILGPPYMFNLPLYLHLYPLLFTL